MYHINLDEIKNIDYKIVSLGLNCLPRTILTRWGLKPARKQGELTMSFDLATFETFELTNCIKTNFENFFENIEFKRKFPFFGQSCWIKSPDLIEFIHEKKLAKNDKEKLITIYTNRIKNFRSAIEDETPVLFVQLLGNCEDTENLYKALAGARKDKPFKLVIIDTQDIVNSKNPAIQVLKIPYPNKNYQKKWWAKKCYESKEGKEFEHSIAEFCLNQIKAMLNLCDCESGRP